MQNQAFTEGLQSAVRVLLWLQGSRVLLLGGGASNKQAFIQSLAEYGLVMATVDPVPLLESNGGLAEPFVTQLQHHNAPIDLLLVDLQSRNLPRAKEPLLEVIRAALGKLHSRSLILIDESGQRSARAETIVQEAETQGYSLLFARSQSLLIPATVRERGRELSELPIRRFESLSVDDAVELQRQGALWQAQRVYEQVLRHDSNHAGAMHLLGLVHHQRNKHELAKEFIGKAIVREPRNAIFHNNYGAAHQSAGEVIEALGCFNTAVALQPKYADALSNVGNTWETLGQLGEAERYYRQALEHKPQHLDTLRRLGELLARRGLRREAAELLERASAAAPPTADLLTELGNVYMIDSKPEKAAAAYRRSLELNPNQPATRFNYAGSLAQQDLIEEARQECRMACQAMPSRPIWRLREMLMCPTVFPSSAAIDEFRSTMTWRLDQLLADPPKVNPRELVNIDFYPPFALSFQGREHKPLKEKFAEFIRRAVQPLNVEPLPGQKPKVGFVVTRGHEGGFIRGTAGIAARLNRQLMDVVILCPECSEPVLRNAVKGFDVEFVTFREDLESAVTTIANARCHVLYYWEVGTDSLDNILPYYRLAPVQVTAWGTQVTTGMKEVDYYLSSHLIETDVAQQHYTEKLVCFDTMPTFQKRIAQPSPVGREFFNLPTDRPVYLCPQTILKLHPEQDAYFAAVLEADPKGVLIIKEGQHAPAVQVLKERMRQSLGSHFDRVNFMPWLSRDDFFRLLTQADAILDTHYFSAGSTSYDIFSYNEPIVSYPGIWNIGRYTLACYRRMGVEGLIANSPEEYARIAVRLANDRKWQQEIRRAIQERSEAIFCDPLTVAEHERFFLERSH